MRLFDSHCHLDDKSFKNDMADVIDRATEANVQSAMIVGVTKKSSENAVNLANKYSQFYASVGIHPHDANQCSEDTLNYLLKLSRNKKVKAWGEIGLDFNRMHSSGEDQEKWFIKQLKIAESVNLPLIFHERDSEGRFLEILKKNWKNGMSGVVHCFSGNKAELMEYLDMGLYIGITGIITIKTRGIDLRELTPLIPVDRLLVETDAPYLTPAPQKNKTRRNEPAFVKSTLLKVAEVINVDSEILSEKVYDNSCKLFNI